MKIIGAGGRELLRIELETLARTRRLADLCSSKPMAVSRFPGQAPLNPRIIVQIKRRTKMQALNAQKVFQLGNHRHLPRNNMARSSKAVIWGQLAI